MRSSTRRACCASTRLVSTCRGLSKAARMALGVISLNVTRKIFFGSMATTSFFAPFSSSFLTGSSGAASFFLNLETLGSCSMNLAGLERTMAVRGDGFSLAVGVARQIHCLGGVRCFPQIVDDLALAGDDLQGRLENLIVVDADQLRSQLFRRLRFLASFAGFLSPFLFAALFFAGQTNADRFLGKVHDVADGRLDGEIPPQIFVNRFRLCGRFHNNQRTSHIAFVTP